MKALHAIALSLLVGTVIAQTPEPVVVESVTEVFVGFIQQDGTAVAGPLKDFQPSSPKCIAIYAQ
jgi:hypothetical protein